MGLEKILPGDEFNPWISLKKFFTGLIITIVPVSLMYTSEFLETETFPPEYAGWIAVAVAVTHTLINLVKHWNDGK
jgi:hypothetical protein